MQGYAVKVHNTRVCRSGVGRDGAANAQLAQAVVIEGISIDRDLSDWPEGMKRYPIRTKCIVDGTELAQVDLQGEHGHSA